MTRAIAYVRVSTDEQSETGVSLAAQEAKIRSYCDLYGIELVDIVVDAGESGKSLDRPGIQAALARLDRKEADGIVIAKLDRLSRNVGDWNWLITEYFGERPGKQVWSVNDQIDTRTSDGPNGAQHPHVSGTVGTRSHCGTNQRCPELQEEQSRRAGIGPDSLRQGDWPLMGSLWLPSETEQEVLATIRELRASGMTLMEIAAALNARGIQKREGGQWEHTFVSRVF